MTSVVPLPASLPVVVREWGRMGCVGFGGPPAHIALLRKLCVTERTWMSASEFEDAVATTNLLPGPASTQLAIYCAWRVRGRLGAIVGGLCFILPGLAMMLLLSGLFLASDAPLWVRGAAAGAGAAVPAVALSAAYGFVPSSWKRADGRPARVRWVTYLSAGAAGSILIGPWLVLVLVGCGLVETLARADRSTPRARQPASGRETISHDGLRPTRQKRRTPSFPLALPFALPRTFLPAATATGGLASLAWVALKVGALSYGGGFVIIPLMQHDAVTTYHWMTGAAFLTAVALGQITPGPVVLTVAAVGYAAGGVGGALLATLVAFLPSFAFVLAGATHFDRLRASVRVQAFLSGAGPAAIGGIAGAAVPLGMALSQPWQAGVMILAAIALFAARRGVVSTLLGAAVVGTVAVLCGL